MKPELFKNRYRVGTIRRQNWDYSAPGFYFVTISTFHKIKYLGFWDGNNVVYSEAGRIVHEIWKSIPDHFDNAVLDEFVVMPDHVHGIIQIETCHGMSPPLDTHPDHGMSPPLGTHSDYGMSPPLDTSPNQNIFPRHNKFSKPVPKSLSMIINHFKGSVTRQCNKKHIPIKWQSLFYENIIKNEGALKRIRWYIKNNPQIHAARP
ncbi:hypothetical protein OAL67_01140 [bacterium]|nr:hypothetical protein [bacterium]